MSHNLYNDGTKDCMFVVGQRQDAWHMLGQRCDKAANSAEAIQLSGLDYEVFKTQNSATRPDGTIMPVDSYTVFHQNGKQLGTVGAQYTVKQNREMFSFVDTLLEANGGSHYDSAGALGNGERVWMAVRLPKADLNVAGQDKHETYLVFMSSHDSSMSHTVLLSSVRVVCQNTFNAALSNASRIVKVKHTKNGDDRLDRVRGLMQGVVQDAQTLQAKFDVLTQRKMTRESMTSILDKLFPKTKDAETEQTVSTTRRDGILAEVLRCYESNDNNAFPEFRGTAYNLLNAITEYTDHFRGTRITSAREGMSISTARAENAIAGTGDELKREALEVITEMTAGAPIHRIVSRPINSGSAPVAGVSLLDQIISNN